LTLPRVFVLAGRDVGRSFEVGAGAVLGRGADCEVRLHDLSVSRRHARLELAEGRWFLVDLGSRNGLRKDGELVQRAPIADHDEVLVGELPLRFRLDEGAPAAPPRAPARAASNAPAARPARSAPLGPPARPAPRGLARPEPEEEIRLEDDAALEQEIELAATRVRARETLPSAGAAASLGERERRRLEVLRASGRAGAWSSDLAQQPLWVRALVYLAVLALFAGLAFGAFRAVAYLRGTL
jgi:hypothetical protein